MKNLSKLLIVICVLAFGLNATHAQMRRTSVQVKKKRSDNLDKIDVREFRQDDVYVPGASSRSRIEELRKQVADDIVLNIPLERLIIYKVLSDNSEKVSLYCTCYYLYDNKEIKSVWYGYYEKIPGKKYKYKKNGRVLWSSYDIKWKRADNDDLSGTSIILKEDAHFIQN